MSLFDADKELQRWKGFMSNLTEDEPKTGLTPKQAIWRKNKATLWYYPATEKKYDVPVFLVYSLVNQPFILDLQPGASKIEAFVNNGYDVYLIDFGIPSYEDKDTTLSDYVVDYIQKGIQRALRHSEAKEITVIGYCLGGTLAAMYAAIAWEPIKNLILFVTPIDFHATNQFDKVADELLNGQVDIGEVIDAHGIIPGSSVEAAMRLMTSPFYFSRYLSLLNKSYDKEYVEKWRRFNKWTKGHIPFPGGALKQLIYDLGKDNQLVKGEMLIRGKRADLSHIDANLLVVSSQHDRLVPKEQSYPIMDQVSSKDKTFLLVEGGHTHLTVKKGQLPETLTDWLPQRSNRVNT